MLSKHRKHDDDENNGNSISGNSNNSNASTTYLGKMDVYEIFKPLFLTADVCEYITCQTFFDATTSEQIVFDGQIPNVHAGLMILVATRESPESNEWKSEPSMQILNNLFNCITTPAAGTDVANVVLNRAAQAYNVGATGALTFVQFHHALRHAAYRTVQQIIDNKAQLHPSSNVGAMIRTDVLAFTINLGNAIARTYEKNNSGMPDYCVQRIERALCAIDGNRLNVTKIAERIFDEFKNAQDKVTDAVLLVPAVVAAMRAIGAKDLLTRSFISVASGGSNNGAAASSSTAGSSLGVSVVLGQFKGRADAMPRGVAEAVRAAGVEKVTWHPVNAMWTDADITVVVSDAKGYNNVVVPCREKFDGIVPIINNSHCALTMRKLAARAKEIVVFRSSTFNTVVLFKALNGNNNNKMTAQVLRAMTKCVGSCDVNAGAANAKQQQQQQQAAAAASSSSSSSSTAAAVSSDGSAPAASTTTAAAAADAAETTLTRREILVDGAEIFTPMTEYRVTTAQSVTAQALSALAGVEAAQLLHENKSGGTCTYTALFKGSEKDARAAFKGMAFVPTTKLLRETFSPRWMTIKAKDASGKWLREHELLVLANALIEMYDGAFASLRYGTLRVCLPRAVTAFDTRQIKVFEAVERAIPDDMTPRAVRLEQQQQQQQKPSADAAAAAAASPTAAAAAPPETIIDVKATTQFSPNELKKLLVDNGTIAGITNANTDVAAKPNSEWKEATVTIKAALSAQQLDALKAGLEIKVTVTKKKPPPPPPKQQQQQQKPAANATASAASAAAATSSAAATAAAAVPTAPDGAPAATTLSSSSAPAPASATAATTTAAAAAAPSPSTTSTTAASATTASSSTAGGASSATPAASSSSSPTAGAAATPAVTTATPTAASTSSSSSAADPAANQQQQQSSSSKANAQDSPQQTTTEEATTKNTIIFNLVLKPEKAATAPKKSK